MPVNSFEAYLHASHGQYTISTDPARLDIKAIYQYITESYWARGRTYETVARTLEHSLCFGLYSDDTQIGFARVITDYAVSAHLCDVYVLHAYQGQGLGKWLVRCALDHPELRTVRRWTLNTADAHGFYTQFGFRPLATPEIQMELVRTFPS